MATRASSSSLCPKRQRKRIKLGEEARSRRPDRQLVSRLGASLETSRERSATDALQISLQCQMEGKSTATVETERLERGCVAVNCAKEEGQGKTLITEDQTSRRETAAQDIPTPLRLLHAHTAGQGSGAAHERCARKCGDGQTKYG